MKSFHIKKFLKGEYTCAEIIDYFRGNIRYYLYYSKYMSWLLPEYIGDQINMRVKLMNPECYNKGECVVCGCKTLNLQMANKSCDDNCYPPIFNKSTWKRFCDGETWEDENYMWKYYHGIITCFDKKNRYKIRKRRKI